MNTFELIIVAYNSIVYKGSSTYCGIITPNGSLGLEAYHEPCLSTLKENSTLHYKNSYGEEKSLQIQNGLLSFKQNKCVITVSLIRKE